MLHAISARYVARDLHTVAPGPLERTCWRRFAAQWGDLELRLWMRLLLLFSFHCVPQTSTALRWCLLVFYDICRESFSVCVSMFLIRTKIETKWSCCNQNLRSEMCWSRECSLDLWNCLFVGCLTSQQHASVSQGRICSDSFTFCDTEIEVADQTFHLTQSQYTDTGPTSPSTDPGRVATGVPIVKSLVWLDSGKIPSQAGIRTRDLSLSRRTPYPLGQRGGGASQRKRISFP